MSRVGSVDEIRGWRLRRGNSTLGYEFSARVARLREVWNSSGSLPREARDIVPLRLVTIIEVFVREAVRELIERGEPFLGRAQRLFRNTKLDFEFLCNLGKQSVSIGDLIAHTVPVSSFSQVMSNMEALLPNFREELKQAHPRWAEEEGDWPLPPIIEDFEATAAALTRLFEVRHELTHELPRVQSYADDEVEHWLSGTRAFIDAAGWSIVVATVGSYPMTQLAMNQQAGRELEAVQEDIDSTVVLLQANDWLDSDKLLASQEAWSAFADAHASFRAARVAGGSLYPLIWAGARTRVAKARLAQLEALLDTGEGDL